MKRRWGEKKLKRGEKKYIKVRRDIRMKFIIVSI